VLFDSDGELEDEQKIRLIQGIAAGMLHLHKHNIIHRDLAARNILLTANGDPKISVLSFFVFFFYLIDSFQYLFLCIILILLNM
jgi:serine/threonine protein kinase